MREISCRYWAHTGAACMVPGLQDHAHHARSAGTGHVENKRSFGHGDQGPATSAAYLAYTEAERVVDYRTISPHSTGAPSFSAPAELQAVLLRRFIGRARTNSKRTLP